MGPSSPDWFALEDDTRAQCVKPGQARKTWRVTLDDCSVYAKVLDGRGLVEAAKRIAGLGAARREWRASRSAERRNVPVARSLAIGDCDGPPRRTAYLSQAVDRAINLTDAWNIQVASRPTDERRATVVRLIDAVAGLYATAHDRGFVPRDGHAGNIVVRPGSGLALEALLVDVHPAVVTRRASSLRGSARSLAQIDHYFRRLATRTERLRFLRTYVVLRFGGRDDAWRRSFKRRLLAVVTRFGAYHAARLGRSRDRRLRRSGKYFSSFRLSGNWRATVTLALARRHVFPEADVADRTQADWRIILTPLTATIHDGNPSPERTVPADLAVETTRATSLSDRLLWTLFGSPHRKVFERDHRLRHRDQPAQLVLACAEHRSAGLVDATLLIRRRHSSGPGEPTMGQGDEVTV